MPTHFIYSPSGIRAPSTAARRRVASVGLGERVDALADQLLDAERVGVGCQPRRELDDVQRIAPGSPQQRAEVGGQHPPPGHCLDEVGGVVVRQSVELDAVTRELQSAGLVAPREEDGVSGILLDQVREHRSRGGVDPLRIVDENAAGTREMSSRDELHQHGGRALGAE